MARKCQKHRQQTNPLHGEEDTQNRDSHNTTKVKQPALAIANLETTHRNTHTNKDPTHHTKQ